MFFRVFAVVVHIVASMICELTTLVPIQSTLGNYLPSPGTEPFKFPTNPPHLCPGQEDHQALSCSLFVALLFVLASFSMGRMGPHCASTTSVVKAITCGVAMTVSPGPWLDCRQTLDRSLRSRTRAAHLQAVENAISLSSCSNLQPSASLQSSRTSDPFLQSVLHIVRTLSTTTKTFLPSGHCSLMVNVGVRLEPPHQLI
jgi:hypothetical protein